MALKPISGGVDGMFRRNSYFPLSGQTASDTYVPIANSHVGPNVFYYPRLDRMYAINDNNPDELIRWDPIMFDNTSPVAGIQDLTDTRSAFAVGEWDKVNNTQRVYSAINVSDLALQGTDSSGSIPPFTVNDVSPFAVALGTGAFYPVGPNANLAKEDNPATAGSFDGNTGNMIVFETWGYAIQSGIAVRDAGLTWYSDCLALIDLTDGHSVPFSEEGFRVGFSGSPHAYQNPSIFGDVFTLNHVQFVPDDDSQLENPKGLLAFSNDGRAIHPDGTSSGDRVRFYVRLTEFNPNGLTATPGNPSRTHGRVINFSRFHCKGDIVPESGGFGGSQTVFGTRDVAHYHPPTETWMVHGTSGDSLPRADVTQARFSNAVLVDTVSNPTEESQVQTGKTATFAVTASGDIGEPASNIDISWSLRAGSTREEALDTSAAPATTTLTNVPLDGEIVEIRYNGTLLVESVDYTIVLATGVITWAGTHAPPDTSGYTATYSHRAALVDPPFGVLLTTLSKTDLNGKATARVLYAADSDLENVVDAIEALDSQ